MTVVAGIDVGNATTEIVLCRRCASSLCRWPCPHAGPEGVAGVAARCRRPAAPAGTAGRVSVTEARIAPLRPVDTFVRVVPDVPPATGRLRVLAAGVATPGGAGACAGPPLLLSRRAPARMTSARAGVPRGAGRGARPG